MSFLIIQSWNLINFNALRFRSLGSTEIILSKLLERMLAFSGNGICIAGYWHINLISMKKLTLIAIGLVGLSACDKPAKTTEKTTKNEQKVVGADQDDHGCIASAGQTWSALKNDCIQVFNEGFRLNPVAPQKDAAVISAFVVLSDDETKLELFLPDQANHHTTILTKAGNGNYQNDQYKYDPVKSILYVNGVEKYKGNVE